MVAGAAIHHGHSGSSTPTVSTYPAHTATPVTGVADPNATLAKLCTPGYTKTIRPPQSYTTSLKIKQLREWHYTDQKTSDYEEDHFIPLEVGGHPTDPNNLFPQPWAQAHVKDREENALHTAMCSGQMTIVQAQQKIVGDWR